MGDTGERPLCEAEVFTDAGGDAQRIFPGNRLHTSIEQCIASPAENKLERFVRCLGVVKTDPDSLPRAPGLSRGKVRLMVMDWGGQHSKWSLT